MVGLPAIMCAILIELSAYRSQPIPPKPMNLARIQELQAQANDSCRCEKSNGINSIKNTDCWDDFKREVARYQYIKGPQSAVACVGWAADSTLTFGPPVSKRLEKERRYSEFMDRISEKEKADGFSIPSDFDIMQAGEISDEAPEWTVTTKRILGGCTAQDEKRLAFAKKVAQERKLDSGHKAAPTCG
jgi:hypothetical protein